MNGPYFFGYGSLVNRATHAYADAHPARIAGWRRAWRHVEGRKVAFLTAVPDPDSEIDGLVAHVPGGDWAALDMREHAYARVMAERVTHALGGGPEIHIYHAPEDMHVAASSRRPVLLSYLDVVVQGFNAVYGAAGVQRFFDTTDGWDTVILNDREDPVYPRHQSLLPDETALVDDHLRRLSAQVKQRHETTLTSEF